MTVALTPDSQLYPRRLGFLLWGAGMAGVIAVVTIALPRLLPEGQLPAPMPVLMAASLLQSGLLLALAVWAGVRFGHRFGLRAPAFEAAVTGAPIGAALRPQLLPGLVAGVLGGVALMVVVARLAPASLASAADAIPIVARILYGGITEELLLRWGLMTLLAWLLARLAPGASPSMRSAQLWVAIVVSALLFAAGHLPAARMIAGSLTPDVVAYVLLANTAFGVLFGVLFRRWGLESAIIAHGVTHLVAWGLLLAR